MIVWSCRTSAIFPCQFRNSESLNQQRIFLPIQRNQIHKEYGILFLYLFCIIIASTFYITLAKLKSFDSSKSDNRSFLWMERVIIDNLLYINFKIQVPNQGKCMVNIFFHYLCFNNLCIFYPCIAVKVMLPLPSLRHLIYLLFLPYGLMTFHNTATHSLLYCLALSFSAQLKQFHQPCEALEG